MGISFSEPERLSLIFDSQEREEWQKSSKVLEKLGFDESRKSFVVADVGAGTGYFTNLFLASVSHVVAIDCEPNMVSYLNQRFQEQHDRVSVVQSTPIDPCIPEGVDLVFIANAYRFIEQRAVFLNNLYTEISSTCVVALLDLKTASARVSPEQARTEAEQAGFIVTELDKNTCPDHYMMMLAKV